MHLVDLDSEEHDNAPFSREANAILERTDELIGSILAALPQGSALAIVSDHGFERVDTLVNLKAVAAKQGVNLIAYGGIALAKDEAAAEFLRTLKKDAAYGIGREIPKDEVARFPSVLPLTAGTVFESSAGFMFAQNGGTFSKPSEIGNHGHWPMRYRAVYVLWGPDISHETIPEFSMKLIAGKLANVLGISFAP